MCAPIEYSIQSECYFWREIPIQLGNFDVNLPIHLSIDVADVAGVIVEPDGDGLLDGSDHHVKIPPRQYRSLHRNLLRQTPAIHCPRVTLGRRFKDLSP